MADNSASHHPTAQPHNQAQQDPHDLTWLPAWQLRDLMVRREVPALVVTNHFLERIERLDPLLHMFRSIDPAAARQQAEAADKALAAGDPPGLLHGVPIAIKEHIAVRGFPCLKMSSIAATEATMPVAEHDSIVTERLRKAGAIILGTTIMPGMGLGPGMPELAQHPRNPWDTGRVPGSSSAGSAAAVASGALPVAIGTDGGGSTRLPAALTGIIGLHPTIGRVPNVSFQNAQLMLTNTVGPLTRDVRDTAIILQAIAGPDGRDMLSTSHGPAPDYLEALQGDANSAKLAWTDDFGFGNTYAVAQSPRIIATVRQAAAGFTALGAAFMPVDEQWESFWPHFITTDLAYSTTSASRPAPEQLAAALDVRMRNRAKFDAILNRFDALLSPTIYFTAPTLADWQNSWRDIRAFSPVYGSATFMLNWIGLPAISIPCGFVDGLPIGLQLVGQAGSEGRLLSLARSFLDQYPRAERPPLT